MKIYLDTCCYNRPFDDQNQERIHLESEAILAILNRCQSGLLEVVGSAVLKLEIIRMGDFEQREKVFSLYAITKNEISYSFESKSKERAERKNQ